MADNLINYTQGTAGGTIATDEVVIGGATVHAQRVKVIDGTEGGTAGLAISSSGVAQTFQTNSGTVSVSNTVATWNSNGGTITLGGVSGAGTLLGAAGTVNVGNAVAVWPNSAGTTTIAGVTNGGTLLGAAGTVNVANTVAVWNSNGGTATIGGVTSGGTLLGAAGTVNVANAVAVWPNSAGTVTQGTDPWIIAGTVTSSVSVGDVAITGGTVAVTQETSPWVIAGTVDTTVNVGDVAITGGTLDLVKAGTVAAWVNTAGTVQVSNTVPVWTNNGGTVVLSNVTGGGTLLGAAGTVNVANTVATWNSNGGTVVLGGVSTVDALEVWPNTAGTVSVSSGVIAAWVNTAGTVASLPGSLQGYAEDLASSGGEIGVQVLAIRRATATDSVSADGDFAALQIDGAGKLHTSMGSAVTFLGKTQGGTLINLTASGTVVPLVASKVLKVYSEHFTVQGGTITVTVRAGNGGGTLSGPRQFVPGGGVARVTDVTAPFYKTPAGSAIYFEISGSGTVGGDIAWVQEDS